MSLRSANASFKGNVFSLSPWAKSGWLWSINAPPSPNTAGLTWHWWDTAWSLANGFSGFLREVDKQEQVSRWEAALDYLPLPLLVFPRFFRVEMDCAVISERGDWVLQKQIHATMGEHSMNRSCVTIRFIDSRTKTMWRILIGWATFLWILISAGRLGGGGV